MSVQQVTLPLDSVVKVQHNQSYRKKLKQFLTQDLDFHDKNSKYASHNFHAFPAKFPPQLPEKFIKGLTSPGDVVLDPMMGSGTTVLEAFLSGRQGLGLDIDPLALHISQVKSSQLDLDQIEHLGSKILNKADHALKNNRVSLKKELINRWDAKTKKFIDYWFAPETQIELLTLLLEIEKIADETAKSFFKLIFSAIIITKSGGVSLAFDLAHTRPHKAKVVISQDGEILHGKEFIHTASPRIKFLTKTLRSPLVEFKKRFNQNLKKLLPPQQDKIVPTIKYGNAQSLPLGANSIDLIVTSPPYVSNAIDYMRAHKFSLVWLEHSIDNLGQKRKEYIGGEAISNINFEQMPIYTANIISEISKLDRKKGRVLHRYYSEMTRTLQEMYRVLRPGKAAIVVVGSSIMRGQDTQPHTCLADIGQTLGFEVPHIGVRNLDRNRRMMPAGMKINLNSQIQQRMHEEYVLGFYKPIT